VRQRTLHTRLCVGPGRCVSGRVGARGLVGTLHQSTTPHPTTLPANWTVLSGGWWWMGS
jgi:hypothetical protein